MSGKEALLRARSHFRASRTVETLRKLTVPEWDLDIHYWPTMSVEESREVGRHIRVGTGAVLNAADITDAALTQVLQRARDAHGVRMFTDEDETALRDTDPAILRAISEVMGIGNAPALEDAEKN